MQKLSRRNFIRLAGGAAAGVAAAGLPALGLSSLAQDKQYTLLFPSWQQDEPGSGDWFRARIAEFTDANPNVTIDFTKVGLGDHIQRLVTQFAAGAPPQIIHLPFRNYAEIADPGFLEPLDSRLEGTDILETWSPFQASAVWKGQTYAIVLLAYGFAMVYNEQLFEEAGVDVPTTGEEFVAAAKALTNAPDQFGFGTTTVPGGNMANHIITMITGAGGRVTTDGVPSVNTPEAVQGMEWWVDIVKSGASPTGTDTGPLRQLYQQGKMAMYFDGPWGQGFIAGADENVKPHLKAAPMPFNGIVPGAISNVIGMAADIPDDEKDVTWAFLQSLTTAAAQKDYVLKYCVAPARLDLQITEEELHDSCPLIDSWLSAGASPNLVDTFPTGLETVTSDLFDMLSETGQILITSDASVKDEMDKLQENLLRLQENA
jgi:multiple sugar transport system substrate-binding protein